MPELNLSDKRVNTTYLMKKTKMMNSEQKSFWLMSTISIFFTFVFIGIVYAESTNNVRMLYKLIDIFCGSMHIFLFKGVYDLHKFMQIMYNKKSIIL